MPVVMLVVMPVVLVEGTPVQAAAAQAMLLCAGTPAPVSQQTAMTPVTVHARVIHAAAAPVAGVVLRMAVLPRLHVAAATAADPHTDGDTCSMQCI